jgi:peptidoglycan/xylan/chitin deacetylase (PgdA/CDA1 family)
MLADFVSGVSRKIARHHRSKPWVMRNDMPLVSFTFDDVPDSAYTNGAAILEEYGMHGTFYIASGTCGVSGPDWRVIERDQVGALHERGHEIGCHTFSHAHVDQLDADALDRECRRNRELLQELCPGVALTNFCYPFGRTSFRRKLQLVNAFASCRGIYEGINVGIVDLAMLRVVELYDRTLTTEKLQHVMSETRRRNGWLIFYTHDVADPPSWIGCSPALLRAAVKEAQAAQLRCLPIRDALTAIGYAPTLQRLALSRDGYDARTPALPIGSSVASMIRRESLPRT